MCLCVSILMYSYSNERNNYATIKSPISGHMRISFLDMVRIRTEVARIGSSCIRLLLCCCFFIVLIIAWILCVFGLLFKSMFAFVYREFSDRESQSKNSSSRQKSKSIRKGQADQMRKALFVDWSINVISHRGSEASRYMYVSASGM